MKHELSRAFPVVGGTGRLIVFSGLDGAGKSTQIDLLMRSLRTQGENPVYLWTRGGYTGLMEKAKTLARHLLRRKMPQSGHSEQRTRTFRKAWVRSLWLLLAVLDLMRVYGVQVRWWHWRGRTVVCDRYIWDTQIDFRLNFAEENVERWRLWRWLARVSPRPDAVFMMLIPVEESVRRSDIKGEPYRNTASELAERLHQYKIMAQKDHWQVLDGRRSISDLQHEIDGILNDTAFKA